MFKKLTNDIYEFKGVHDLNFQIYNSSLVDELLGPGKQTSINFGGSLWKKEIYRNKTARQKESIKFNPKYFELKDIILGKHLTVSFDFDKFDKDDIKTLLSDSLKEFKENGMTRQMILKEILNDDFQFKKNIDYKYAYILFSLYCAFNFSYYDTNEEEKFKPILFNSKKDYIGKYISILKDESYAINNLTCFCYRQYFWADFRLSQSLDSKIHDIIYDIFENLNITPHKKKNTEKISQKIEFKPLSKSFGALLDGKSNFYVPNNQRNYSWTSVQIKSFLIDLFNIFENKDTIEKYFLGSMVLINKDYEKYEIIDGQQRITTIFLLLNILREQTQNNAFQQDIESYLFYNFKNEYNQYKKVSKLILNQVNNNFFKRHILEKNSKLDYKKDPDYRFNKLLINNSDIIRKEIQKYYNDSDNDNKLYDSGNNKIDYEIFLGQIFEIIEKKLYIISINVENEKSSYLIFETLNTRGLLLEEFEKIRNHILGRSFDKEKEIEDLINALEKENGKKNTLYFTQVYRSKFLKRYKDIQKNYTLFDHFKNNLSINHSQYYDFICEMHKEIYDYKKLIMPSEDDIDNNELNCKKIVQKLKILKAFNLKGIYLILLSSFEEKFHFKRILNLSLKVAFENKFSKNLPHNANEIYQEISHRIRNKSITIQEIEEKLQTLSNTKEKIKANFLEDEIYKENSKSDARRILAIINRGRFDFDYLDQFSVEHVYSTKCSNLFKDKIKKIELESKGPNKKEIKYNPNHIYNLTLLPSKENSALGIKEIDEKIDKYGDSHNIILPTNKKLVELYQKYGDYCYNLVKDYQEFLWSKVEETFNL